MHPSEDCRGFTLRSGYSVSFSVSTSSRQSCLFSESAGGGDGARDWCVPHEHEEFRRVSEEAREGFRGAARKLAANAGLSSLPAGPEQEPAARDVNRHGGAHVPVAAAAVKTPTPVGLTGRHFMLNLNCWQMLGDGQ